MLTSSVEYGTSKRAAIEGIPLAAKTGTSTYDDATNNKDAWIVSYNSQYIVCCWMGFDKTDDEDVYKRQARPYQGEFAVRDTAMEVRHLRSLGVSVLGVFAGREEELLSLIHI